MDEYERISMKEKAKIGSKKWRKKHKIPSNKKVYKIIVKKETTIDEETRKKLSNITRIIRIIKDKKNLVILVEAKKEPTDMEISLIVDNLNKQFRHKITEEVKE